MPTNKISVADPDVTSSNHYSVHLDWSSSLLQFKYHILNETERIYTIAQQCEGHIEHEDGWKNVYIGYGEHTVVMDLNACSQYMFRVRFHRSDDDYTYWSPPAKIFTAKEPFYGENLHKAVRRQKIPEIVDVLNSGHITVDVPDNHGLSALMNTAKRGQPEIMKVLLSYNASVSCKDEAGKTALMHACIYGQISTVKLLRTHGAIYEDYDLGGTTPLHYAIDSCNCDLIEWMITDGANVNIQDRNAGWTPLMRCASLHGNKLVAYTLIHNKADIDLRDINGKTCLMIAVVNGYLPLVELLLENNANITIYNTSGRTAFEIAVSLERRVSRYNIEIKFYWWIGS
ncbi:fibronectin type 3 and ankyrin repeat domains 1 protein-like isoform X2 [Octopus sinensis]|uniref:Fibronectin type 3 and ankyrin repeat domains 1 protein-like isoform X2 n=1 Tax=Octopus sinensis TaxID=2607531 RepID=A0A7E6FAK3_9MOLL|nr:fibronectin type 3 and ankyrin repeat domains 1 protein-like isoform X2 [Octopus sinensis]